MEQSRLSRVVFDGGTAVEVRRYRHIDEFVLAVEPFLVEREAEHNLMLGISTQVRRSAIEPEGVLYLASVHDDTGQTVAAALRTPPHNVAISQGPVEAIDLLVEDILSLYRSVPGVLGPKEESRRFAESWRRMSGQGYRPGVAQRIYQLGRLVPVSSVPGRMRTATLDDREWLADWSNAFMAETREPVTLEGSVRTINGYLTSDTRGMHIWEDAGNPVSIAGYAGPTPNGIRVSHVYTPPELRGRGYASALTAALSQHLLDVGYRKLFLFTDLSNPTSNSIYQRIGYQPVADVDEWLFTVG